jgi:hypothetical protein
MVRTETQRKGMGSSGITCQPEIFQSMESWERRSPEGALCHSGNEECLSAGNTWGL